MVRKIKIKATIVLMIALSPCIARAEFLDGLYFGGGYGRSSLEAISFDEASKADQFRLSPDLTAKVNGTPRGLQFFVGRDFYGLVNGRVRIAVEYRHLDIGRFSGFVYESSGVSVAPYWISLTADELSLRFSLPLTQRLTIFERLGISRLTTMDRPQTHLSGNRLQLVVGIPGVEYVIFNNVFARLEWVPFQGAVGGTLLNYASISVGYKL